MTVKEFSIKLNALSQYALDMANIDKRKTKIFINGLRANIAKEVLIGDNFS